MHSRKWSRLKIALIHIGIVGIMPFKAIQANSGGINIEYSVIKDGDIDITFWKIPITKILH
jgi:hypothetical protein